ncbi:MAG TPA: NYN domain-containing protein [Clostridiales bacterium]|jgi:Fe-S-cluster formation regulator IscX/YfhJ|nr:NYN domain-containing protein [Clostridiales bacterium]
MKKDNRFAVLIDADNISDKYVRLILDEISNDGVATYKRIYGDWTKPALGPWKKVLLDYSITPIQQYGYTTGKNSTDAAMIIDAMDILYSGNVDGFCLVTSDSDFTRLAARLRESGMDVVGMGERKTPKAFVASCNKFKYLDILAEQEADVRQKNDQFKEKLIKSRLDQIKKSKIAIPLPEGLDEAENNQTKDEEAGLSTEMTPLETIREAVLNIIRESPDEEEWTFIGDIGNMLLKRYPDFDVRNYGFKKLTTFVRSLPGMEIKTSRHGNNVLVYVREKGKSHI